MENPIKKIFSGDVKSFSINDLLYRKNPKSDKFCPVCERKVKRFNKLDKFYFEQIEKFSYQYSIFDFETLNVENYTCPKCKASDRERLYALYLDSWISKNNDKKFKLLDFAPNEALQKKVRTKFNISYRSCDQLRNDVDDNIDIQDMNIYGDNEFDIIICSHILEHVENYKKAISELFRILKPGGWGIVMVPILLSIENTIENQSVQTEAERWKYYGQGDHLRTYSKNDFIKILETAGFKVNQLGIDYFGSNVFENHGISNSSVLYIVEKDS